ncbi:PREDICTED: WD repeat-containing protein 3-like [Amphimedon queenslandica]|uniref:Uncharacterized protein n=1 Tax=Amphimedon queenslandica TaxID=400682 RepID=A0AAN0IS48_AMPQE|nr:PREDICTED: WD repeat-containing protein 3-like [Amphimedon queenslandica]|eukprot:XP_011408121.2 PREDICTED: WD repeat-containing protein 3-like [Amphimedon queenslandica]
MSEDVLCLKYSPNDKFLALSLLDSTVKLFFADSLKFYLSLYGHKLPVLGMDISSDSSLLVTGSADKNIRIWGTDFGDCHKSIFGHTDSIMDVKFVPGTHLCFSISKDRTLKQWDCDNFELIQTLKGHQSEIWSLVVSNDGNTAVTGSHDLSIRTWCCTQEPLVLSEEKENDFVLNNTKADNSYPLLPVDVTEGRPAVHFYTSTCGRHMSARLMRGDRNVTDRTVHFFILLAFHEGKFDKLKPKLRKVFTDFTNEATPLIEDTEATHQQLPTDILNGIELRSGDATVPEGVIKITLVLSWFSAILRQVNVVAQLYNSD